MCTHSEPKIKHLKFPKYEIRSDVMCIPGLTIPITNVLVFVHMWLYLIFHKWKLFMPDDICSAKTFSWYFFKALIYVVHMCTLIPHFLWRQSSKIPCKKWKSANNWLCPPTHPKQCFSIFLMLLFSSNKHYDGSCFFFFLQLSEHHAECLEDLLRVLEQFWCSYTLKGTSDVFLFFGRPHKFPKLQSMNPPKWRMSVQIFRP